MYIEDIIIDGFKSYANRTVVESLDPTFNAITGLNGSGKSNILEAICFVLGISNLSQVRVSNLVELVYKQGQAGVSKASVTITFNNSYKEGSPVGYEQYDKITVTRQVAIGGRNKYLINGHNAQLNRVQNLFHSVQLNINNPHFLIMQGRITKVLNMKPPEILAMIEEAAGTRMFEMKKIAALNTIEKKQKKVDEIKKILEEEITPTLETLRKERSDYMTWTNSLNQCERLNRFTIAYDLVKNEESVKNASTQLAQLNKELEESHQAKADAEKELQKLKAQIKKLMEKKDLNNQLSKMEKQEEELSLELVKHQSSFKHQKELLDKESSMVKNLLLNKEEIDQSIKEKTKSKEILEKKIENIVQENNQLNQELKSMQKKFLDMQAGITDGDTENGSFTEQMMEYKREVVNAQSELKQAEIRIKHINNELQAKKKLVNQEASDHKKMQSEFTVVEKELKKLQQQMDQLKFDPSRDQELLKKKKELDPVVGQLREEVGIMSAKLSGAEFIYTDPSKDFDKSKVRGVVANLITLRDPNTLTALEICAGGKLYNVVIEDEATGKALLAKGNLQKRFTFLPLNRIDGRTIESSKVKQAEKLVGKENIQPAISLVEYDKSLENAMNFVFGTTFIAKDKSHAQKVAFDPNVKTKTISLEGDEYNPSGSLTGGSTSNRDSLLSRIQKLNESNSKLKKMHSELEKVNLELANSKSSSDQYKKLHHELELKQHEFRLINDRLKLNPQHQLLENIKEMEQSIQNDTELIRKSKEKEKEFSEKTRKLEEQANNFQSNRDKFLKNMEKKLAQTKEEVAKSNKIVQQESQGIMQIQMELEQLEIELKQIQKQIDKGNDGLVSKLQKELKEQESLMEETRERYQELKDSLEEKRQAIQSQNQAFSEMTTKQEDLQKQMIDLDVTIKQLDHKKTRFHKDQEDISKQIESDLKKYQWIKTERHQFGKEHGDYDFKNQNPQKVRKQLIELTNEIERLSKTINKKVMTMYEKAEQEYQELMSKKEIVENDKLKIENVIAELDEKKNESLKQTWVKVNQDFGSIFSTLLPGTSAKLEPPEGKTVLDGLEVRVAFGDHWKESLTELSGGQKSLLALSLILSLLLFKPAPMYILDEIDAALDLSHTQNIGMMLKKHFTTSQFIVVSLKEGMFNNANVLFETKFVDGVSKVTRRALKDTRKQQASKSTK
ncbi:structural maintenance of chromosome protein [Tieghemostelium lacteum]|uniref:Structural maintenance of chromosomes protein n=1 Tax=Tieghemostelium lacteum TaxID=361077 RepID=A0A151Z712_TIELA|nr:structural maintenance of chromosome protein [Tieghemostelium lacteum]|eukprot:KYQ89750.1 structural maintenance of chromosome protein [Tieghemostelium lacteum]